MEDNKKAIAVISFGTTYTDNAEKTIKVVTEDISKAFEGYLIVQAYTSSIVRKNLADKGIIIPSPEECLQNLVDKGIKEVVVLPTHIISGEEYHKVKDCVDRYSSKFDSISMCRPLISEKDISMITNTLLESFDFDDTQYLLLMGHGSPTRANKIYHLINDEITNRGIDNVYISTVEATPDINNALSKVKKYNPKEVILTPFLLVAGDHANNDMAIEWKQTFENYGYKVKCIIKGLGEYPQFRKIYVDRVREILC